MKKKYNDKDEILSNLTYNEDIQVILFHYCKDSHVWMKFKARARSETNRS